jgi:hypothetical protein
MPYSGGYPEEFPPSRQGAKARRNTQMTRIAQIIEEGQKAKKYRILSHAEARRNRYLTRFTGFTGFKKVECPLFLPENKRAIHYGGRRIFIIQKNMF